MSIFLNKDSRIIVQGMTGGMGSKHTTLMVEAGSNIVGGVNARKAGTSVAIGGKDLSVFVNVFGGITACDAVANGIVEALEILGDSATKPLVVRLDGNNVVEGRRILDEANHPLITQVATMDDAADRAAQLATEDV